MELIEQPWARAASAMAVSLKTHFPAYGRVSVERARVDLDDLYSVIPAIGKSRLAASQSLVQTFLSCGVALFHPVAIPTSVGEEILFPPLVEASSRALVLLDGVHRCMAAAALGFSEIIVLVARAANTPGHVADPVRLQLVEVVERPNGGNPYFAGRSLTNFRPGDVIIQEARRRFHGGV